ncbi:hypothetical protein GM3708_3629 (plasmid) [Geminocystis sp. NIES-3708]|uniref:helix-turn-helix domain-containing protein n=1 Tax=Geminocystis sp. NIES-3708 TaxID=1615909 RepID=UPI0005FC4AC4|nr:helix-turn-helix domain-containing protein [Geminocystis sp. NIES-3708]BAQ63223.1 hypothetical protein GM3708_3629 [Geminocystis sp. NIES-3708]
MSDKLSLTQSKAVILLASGMNYRQTCLKLGISRDALHNWRGLPHFQDAILQEKERQLFEFRQELIELKKDSINILSKFLHDDSVSTTEKIAICFHALALPQGIKVNYLK